MIVLRVPTLTHFKVRSLEWMSGGVLLLCWLILAQPVDLFAANKSLVPLARVMPQGCWAYTCLAISALRLGSLYVNGAWIPSPYFRTITSIFSMVFWLYLTLGVMFSGNIDLSLAVYPILLLCDIYSVGRASSDARLSREARLAKPEAPVFVA